MMNWNLKIGLMLSIGSAFVWLFSLVANVGYEGASIAARVLPHRLSIESFTTRSARGFYSRPSAPTNFPWFPSSGKGFDSNGRVTRSDVFVPLWLPTIGFLSLTGIVAYRKRVPKGHCRCCGYNLVGNVSGICPECGNKFGDQVAKEDGKLLLWLVCTGIHLVVICSLAPALFPDADNIDAFGILRSYATVAMIVLAPFFGLLWARLYRKMACSSNTPVSNVG